MKRALSSLFLLCCLLVPLRLQAQERTVERTYLSTDRDAYIAGETLWCSAFCMDAATGRPSALSSIVYVELHNADGVAATARIALSGGRGGGGLALPLNLPTGNYRLIAYTAQNRNEAEYDFPGAAAKTVSVYNAFSRERVGAVELSEERPAPPEALADAGPLSLTAPATAAPGAVVSLEVTVPDDATFSLSVCLEDGLPHNGNPSMETFLLALSQTERPLFSQDFVPEFEGEIIRGHVEGCDPAQRSALAGRYAFLSAPGSKSDLYVSRIDSLGGVAFFTGNLYGEKELMTEIEGLDTLSNAHLVLEEPFAKPSLAAPAPLTLYAPLADALTARAVAMQIERRFRADTLLAFLPRRDNLLFEESLCHRYRLDDYTRFPLMRETFAEFIPELRVRERGGRTEIQVRVEDGSPDPVFQGRPSLTLLDGVPVFDQEKICRYDPLLVECIEIYPYNYYVGAREFAGIVNFVTFKRNLPAMRFGNSARVVNWHGALLPTAYTCAATLGAQDYPDYRRTAFWHPLLEARGGEPLRIDCLLPGYAGTFAVTVEGVTAEGAPIFVKREISVR